MIRRSTGAAFLVLTLLFTPGCTLIGLGIGAAIPKRELVFPSALREGDDVIVTSMDGSKTSGEFAEAKDGNITIVPADEFHLTVRGKVPQTLEAREVRKVGSHWATGVGIGFVMDALIALALVGLYAALAGSGPLL